MLWQSRKYFCGRMSAQNDFFDVSEQQKYKKNEGMKNSNLAAVDFCAIF